MLDFADRIRNGLRQAGAVLGPTDFAEHVLAHTERLRFYLGIVEDDAYAESSAWDWLVCRSNIAASDALLNLRKAVSAP